MLSRNCDEDNPRIGLAAFSKLFGAGSIYCITPVTEEIARAMQRTLRAQPLSVYDLPALLKDKLGQPLIASMPDEEDFEEYCTDDE